MRDAVRQPSSYGSQVALSDDAYADYVEASMDSDAILAADSGNATPQESSEDEAAQDCHSFVELSNGCANNLESEDEVDSSDAVSETYEQLVLELIAEAEDWDPRMSMAKMYEDVEAAAIKRIKHVRKLVEDTRIDIQRLRYNDRRRSLLEDFYKNSMIPRYTECLRDMQEAFRSRVIIELLREARPLLKTLVEMSANAKCDDSAALRTNGEESSKDSSNIFRRATTRNVSHRETNIGKADKDSTLWTYAFLPQNRFDVDNVHQLFQQARELVEANFRDAATFARVEHTNDDGAEILIDHPATSHGLCNLVALLFYPPTALTAKSRLDIPATRAVLYHIQLLTHRVEIQPYLQWAFDAVREICWSQVGFGLHTAPRISDRERHRFVSTVLSRERERELAASLEPLPQWRNFNPSPDNVLLRCGLVQPDRDLATKEKGRKLPSIANPYYSEWKEGGLVPMCDNWRTMTTEDYLVKRSLSDRTMAQEFEQSSEEWDALVRQTLTEPSGSDELLVRAEPLYWFEDGADDLPLV